MRNFRQIWLLMLLLISSVSAFGQNTALIDNLKLELAKQQRDTGKIRLLITIADQYVTSDTKKALAYIEQAKQIVKRVDCQKCNADILLQEGIIRCYSSDLPNASKKLEKALSLYRKLDIKSKIAWCCLWIGAIQQESMNYNKTMDYYTEAIRLFRLLNDNEGIAYCYYYMATVYSFQNKNKEAIDYDKKAIQMANKKDKQRLARFHLNLAREYITEREFGKALSIMDSIVPVFKEANNLYSLGITYCYIGVVHMFLKDYKTAIANIRLAIDYDSKYGNQQNLMIAKMNLAQVYINSNLPDSAIIVLKELLELNKQLKNIKYADMIYYNLFIAYEKKGDYKSAYAYCNKFIEVNDSIINEVTNKRLLEIQTQYEINLKNEQIKLLVKDKQIAKQKIIILGIGLLLVLISSLYVFVYTRRKTKVKQLLHELEINEAANKIGTKQRELTLKAMQISQQEQSLSYLRDQLENLKNENPVPKKTILDLLSGVNQQLKQNAFNDFEKYFVEVHPGFYDHLKQKYEDLTQNELKVCALLRLNLNTKQIADITGRSTRSVESTRTCIRKKMGLTLQDNLFDAISKI